MSSKVTPRYHGGMDVITLVGAALVTAEHYSVLINRPIEYPPGHMALGKIGVFLFLLTSGYRAAESKHPPANWLWRRLARIYPAYWIVLCAAFLIAGATGMKTFTGWQMLSQFVGLGFYTHPDNLLLEATWFLSPLLVCYWAVFLMRLTPFPKSLAVAALIFCITFYHYATFAENRLSYLAFATGYCLAVIIPARFQSVALFIAGLAVMIVSWGRPHVPKLGLAFMLEAAGLAWPWPIYGVPWLAKRSYEYYLVHGLAFYGALRYLRLDPIVGGVVAIGISAILTEAVFRTVLALDTFGKYFRRANVSPEIHTSRPPVPP